MIHFLILDIQNNKIIMENEEKTINQDQLGHVSGNQDDHENDRSVSKKRKSKCDDESETSTCNQEESFTTEANLNIASNFEQEEKQVHFDSLNPRFFCI
jgi:hypothetical protein